MIITLRDKSDDIPHTSADPPALPVMLNESMKNADEDKENAAEEDLILHSLEGKTEEENCSIIVKRNKLQ